MKIENVNHWLPRPYFVAIYNGDQIGIYSTEEEAVKAYEEARDGVTIDAGDS